MKITERCEYYSLNCEQEKMGCEGCAYHKKSAEMELEEAIKQLKDLIKDRESFLVGFDDEYDNVFKKDIQAIETVLHYLDKNHVYDQMLKINLKFHKTEQENKTLKQENHNLKEQLENFIPRRRVRRVYKMLGKILKQDGIVDDLEEK